MLLERSIEIQHISLGIELWAQDYMNYLVHTPLCRLGYSIVHLHHFIDFKLYLDIYLYCWTRHSFFSIKMNHRHRLQSQPRETKKTMSIRESKNWIRKNKQDNHSYIIHATTACLRLHLSAWTQKKKKIRRKQKQRKSNKGNSFISDKGRKYLGLPPCTLA